MGGGSVMQPHEGADAQDKRGDKTVGVVNTGEGLDGRWGSIKSKLKTTQKDEYI